MHLRTCFFWGNLSTKIYQRKIFLTSIQIIFISVLLRKCFNDFWTSKILQTRFEITITFKRRLPWITAFTR